MKHGFGPKGAIIGLAFPVGTLIGSLTLNPLLSLCQNFTSIFTCFLLFIELLAYISFFFIDPVLENFTVYLIIFGFIFLIFIVPYSKQATN